jgi:uncharacterized Fe-S cluster protein YjdI
MQNLFSSESVDSVMNQLPKQFVAIQMVQNKAIIRHGKCCRKEIYRVFAKDQSGWILRGNVGFEELIFKVKSSSKNGNTIKLSVINDGCDNCKNQEVEMSAEIKSPFIWKVLGDPFGGDKHTSFWIDEQSKNKAEIKIENDCPSDGEAC